MGRPFKEPWLTPEERAAKARARNRETTAAWLAKNRPPKYKHRGPEFSRLVRKERAMLTTYGLTLEDYAHRLVAQSMACPICQRTLVDQPKHPQEPVVDHCHSTGEVRGILCRTCNMGLGLLGDNVAGVLSALSYLQGENHVYQ